MVFCKKIYKEDITLIVHCSAGISRSGAVGTFVNQYLNLDTQKFCFKYSKLIYPNKYILDTLFKVSNLKNKIQEELKKVFKNE